MAGAGVLIRAGAQAYRQAIVSKLLLLSPPVLLFVSERCGEPHVRNVCVDGTKAGVASEGTRAAFAAKQMSLEEASRILGVERNASMEEIVKVCPCISHIHRPCKWFMCMSACSDCGISMGMTAF